MLNTGFRSWLLGGWGAIVATIVGVSVAKGADLSTVALFLLLGVSPAIVMGLLAAGAPSPTVAEILHGVETQDGRR